MFVTDNQGSFALYRVSPDATIEFGGGFDALRDRTTWTGVLTSEEIRELRVLLDESDWFEAAPVGDAGGDPLEHRIGFVWPEGVWRAETEYGGDEIDPIRSFFQRVTGKRHEQYLQLLPEAGKLD